jgi:two-component system, LytTR family, sensor kinase
LLQSIANCGATMFLRHLRPAATRFIRKKDEQTGLTGEVQNSSASAVYPNLYFVDVKSNSIARRQISRYLVLIYSMRSLFNNQRFPFYLKVGGGYLLLWLFVDLASHPALFFNYAVNEVWRAVYIVAINYFCFEYTMKKVTRRRIIFSFFLILFTFLSYGPGLYLWRQLGIDIGVFSAYKVYTDTEHAVGDMFGQGIFTFILFGVIRHAYNYIKLKQATQQLRIEKQQAELNYLKSQTNPHFLFNTLNNIYSLSRDKSDLAPESILRLSKILRFMLYETSGDYIAIEQELKIMSDYIELEKLRYDETLHVNFNYNVEDLKQALPPLLLIPLVENAFKHGASETRGRPFVDIHLTVSKRLLTFIVKNSSETSLAESSVKENIGLSNLRRQLQLLYTDYELSIIQGETVFTATLKINLASHV